MQRMIINILNEPCMDMFFISLKSVHTGLMSPASPAFSEKKEGTNLLYRLALSKIAFLPYATIVDKVFIAK